jgi:hypothetical protein
MARRGKILSEELKPCPFCGSEAKWWPWRNGKIANCSNLNCPNDGQAELSRWNTRPLEAKLEAENARLKSEKDEAEDALDRLCVAHNELMDKEAKLRGLLDDIRMEVELRPELAGKGEWDGIVQRIRDALGGEKS